jgi:hypothetical protein
MRHMYDRDGNITYAGKPRASRPWKSSRYRRPGTVHSNVPEDTVKAAEVELDIRTHKEKIADILAQSKWSNPRMNVEG